MTTATATYLHLTLQQHDLMSALQSLQPVVDKLPPRDAVVLEADGGELVLRATADNEFMSIRVPARVRQAGAVAVIFDQLMAVVSILPDSRVILETKEGSASLFICGDGCDMQILDRDVSLPGPPSAPDAWQFKMSVAELVRTINLTLFAASREMSRYSIAGVYFEFTADGRWRATATDGRRLACLGNDVKPTHSVVVHRRVLTLARMMCMRSPVDAIATFRVANDWLSIEIGSMTVSARNDQGNFPPYRDVIPKETKFAVFIDRAGLIDTLKRAAVNAFEGKVVMRFADRLEISGRNIEVGRSEASVFFEGEAERFFRIGVNSKLLIDALRVMASPTVRVSFTANNRPIVLTADGLLYVCMPCELDHTER